MTCFLPCTRVGTAARLSDRCADDRMDELLAIRPAPLPRAELYSSSPDRGHWQYDVRLSSVRCHGNDAVGLSSIDYLVLTYPRGILFG